MRPLFAAALFAAAVAFLFWIDTPTVRYTHVNNSVACSVQQLVGLPAQLDFVALGSSRVRRGIDPEALVAASGDRLQAVYNLGRPGRDMRRSYMILHDLEQRGIYPKFAYVELNLEALGGMDSRSDNLDYPAAGFLTYSELFHLAEAFPQQRAFAVDVVLNALKSKLTNSLVRHLNGDVWLGLRASARPAEPVCWREAFDRQGQRKEEQKAAHEQELQALFGDLAQAEDDRFAYTPSPANAVELHYLGKIRALAARGGIQLLVGRPWGYAEPPLSAAAVARVQALVPEFVYPPAELVRSHDHEFIDAAHMDSGAREAYSRWLATLMAGEVH